MGKLLRILTGIIVTLIVLIIAAVIIIVTLVNPNDFKDKISTVVQKQTGRTLVIDGKIHWTFFPALGLKVNRVDFGNAPGFTKKSFAKIGEADVRLQLLPLLHGKIRAGKLILKDVTLNLTKNKNGKTNWQDLTKKKSTTKAVPKQLSTAKQQPKTTSKKEIAVKATLFTISGVDIDNANIYWNNKQEKQTAELTKLNFSTSNITFNQPIDVQTDFNFLTTKPNYAGQIKLASKITINVDPQTFKLNSIDLKKSRIAGAIQKDKNKKIPFNLKGDFNYDLTKQQLTAKNFTTKINDFSLKGQLLTQKDRYQGSFVIQKFNARPLLASLGMTPTGKKAYQAVAANLMIKGRGPALSIPALQITLDNTTLHGQVSALNIKQKTLRYNLNINQININDYQLKTNKKPNKPTAAKTAQTKQKTKAKTKTIIPVPYTPPAWNSNGTINIDKLIANKINVTNLKTKIISNKGLINLSIQNANLYQGTLKGMIKLNLQKAVPSFASVTTLTNLKIAPALKELANSDKISGTATLHISLSGQGKAADAITKSLHGAGNIQVLDGTIYGLDIGYELRRVGALVKGKTVPNKPNNPQTKFSKLSGTFTIKSGVISNNNLLIEATDSEISGQGTANLVNKKLNYRLRAMHLESSTQDGKKSIDKQQFFIPIRIIGTFSRPIPIPDYQAVVKTFIKHAITKDTKGTIQNLLQGKKIDKKSTKALGKSINKAIGFKIFN
ncbi:MAG: AsmA family protein [Gammaproteobacteria bacterium]|nr:AsmA family protein [Gammaproteobacteria bacterium]